MFPVSPYYQEHKVSRRLNAIYKRIPSLPRSESPEACLRCGQSSLLELFNILERLEDKEGKEELLRSVILYELLHLAKLDLQCPFFRDGACSLGPAKPLHCRLYGLYPQEDFAKVKENIISDNQQIRDFYSKEMGIELPAEIVSHFADPSAKEGEAAISSQERGQAYMMLWELQDELIPKSFAEEASDSTAISTYVLRLVLSLDELEDTQIKALRVYLDKGNADAVGEMVEGLLPRVVKGVHEILHNQPEKPA